MTRCVKKVHIPLVDATPVREHLTKLTKGGMKRRRIAELAGVSRSSVDGILAPKGKRHTPYNKVSDFMATALLGVAFEAPDPPPELIWYLLPHDHVGTARRLQALAADGFTYKVIAEVTGISTPVVYRHAVTRDSHVHAYTARKVAEGYERVSLMGPEDFGIVWHEARRCASLARDGKDWVPRHVWDSDTIDDPNAIPEWTGACGTNSGYYLHRKYKIFPICTPCYGAHHTQRAIAKRRSDGE